VKNQPTPEPLPEKTIFEGGGEADNREEITMAHQTTRPKFSLGRVLATQGATELLTRQEMEDALRRHASGDWGDVCVEDREENEFSLAQGFRLFSVYSSKTGTKFYVITEADRSATTVLLPDEY
jgi:hypothetical protein